VRDNQQKAAEFSAGNLTLEEDVQETTKRKGTKVSFVADEAIFKNYKYRNEYIIKMLKNYCYLNTGLTIYYNGEKYFSDNGLKDLLQEAIHEDDMVYPTIHLLGDDIEVAITHSKSQYSEEYHSFVNGQNTTQGGTHLGAFREAIVKTIKEFYNKPFEG
jgi:topoisomerase-4 subunit B